MQNVVAALELVQALDGRRVLGLGNDAELRRSPPRVAADFADVVFGERLTGVAQANLVLRLPDRLRQRTNLLVRLPQQMKRKALRRFRPNAWKLLELRDQPRKRPRERYRPIPGGSGNPAVSSEIRFCRTSPALACPSRSASRSESSSVSMSFGSSKLGSTFTESNSPLPLNLAFTPPRSISISSKASSFSMFLARSIASWACFKTPPMLPIPNPLGSF